MWDLLTYLIGHNNPINGFRLGAAHPYRRLCFLRAYASWLHQGFLNLVFPTDTSSSSSPTSADPRIKYPSRRSILLHRNDMAEPAQPLKLIRCLMSMSLRSSYSSLLNRMRKSSPTLTGPRILRRTFLSNTLKAAASVLNSVHASTT